MLIRFNRRTTRLTAVAMLFVWLLVVGMGMANACLANEDHARHGHLQHHEGTLAEPVTAQAQPDSHVPPTSPEVAACQKFCAAAQSSVFKQQSDEPGLMDAGLVFAAIAEWHDSPAPYRTSLWADPLDPGWTELSVAIRFLRLTL